jgi:competence protein ComEA
MRSIFTTKERRVILFLSLLFLLGNGIRLYRRISVAGDERVLDLGSLEPADSAEVAKLLQRSLEIKRQHEAAENVEFPIDINRASLWEMIALPGIGPERAAKIIEERERRGGFLATTDLLDISGIGPRTFAAIEEYIQPIPSASGPNSDIIDVDKTGRIDINRADRRQLETLPGIGAVLAQRILMYRDSHGPFHSIEELKGVKGIGDHRMKDLEPYLTIDGD